jgi:hypothetical protein
MFWQNFFFSFIFNNKNVIKNKLSYTLTSDSLTEYTNIYNSTYNLETINNIYSPRLFTSFSGYDLRYNKTDNSTIYHISRYFRIIEILKIIESDRVSVSDKLDIIDQYDDDLISKYVPNINANNLMNDW